MLAQRDRFPRGKKAMGVENYFRPDDESDTSLFRIEDELTEPRIQKILEDLERQHHNGNWDGFCIIASGLSLLIPVERIPKELFTEETYAVIDVWLSSQKRSYANSTLRMVRTFFPGHFEEFKQKEVFSLTKKKEAVEIARKTRGYQSFSKAAFTCLLLGGDKKQDFELSEEEFLVAIRELKSTRNFAEEEKNTRPKEIGQREKHILLSANMAAIYLPTHAEDFCVDTETAQMGKDVLSTLEKSSSWFRFINIAELLAFLFSDHVEFPEPGMVKIVPKQRRIAEAPSLPIQKEY